MKTERDSNPLLLMSGVQKRFGGVIALSEALAAELDARGIKTETVYCLGNCALGPAAMIRQRLIGRASADRLEQARAEAANA